MGGPETMKRRRTWPKKPSAALRHALQRIQTHDRSGTEKNFRIDRTGKNRYAKKMKKEPWTEGHISELKILWAREMTVASIAIRLKKTQSSIEHKVRRLHLPYRFASEKRIRIPVVHVRPEEPPPPPLPPRKIIRPVELCCWPLGDPKHDDFCFCRNPRIQGKSYCPQHHKVAYTAPTSR